MRTGRPKAELTLTAEERQTLEQWTRRPKTAQALARRARFVLACAAGKTNHAVAAEFKTTGQTVGRWRRRFVDRRLDGLLDEPRPGTSRRTSDADVERVWHGHWKRSLGRRPTGAAGIWPRPVA